MWQLWKKYVLNAFKNGRESYNLGYTMRTSIDRQIDINIYEAKLISLGYQPNYFSFADEGQITSMRKMYVDPQGFWRQIHVRVHSDGEIRGHDELCYEESVIDHVNGVDGKEIESTESLKILAELQRM